MKTPSLQQICLQLDHLNSHIQWQFLWKGFSPRQSDNQYQCVISFMNTRFEAIWRADWLSQHNFIWISPNFNSWRSCLIQITSQVAVAIAIAHSSVFSLCTGPCNNILLFTFPRDKISSNKNTLPWCEASINRRTSPIYFVISSNLIQLIPSHDF